MTWFCLLVWAVAVIAIPSAAVPAAIRSARASRGRWGHRLRVHADERGPYREGIATERIPRAVPLSVWLTAIGAPTWASLTLLLFCPLGGLFVLTGGEAFCFQLFDDSAPCAAPDAPHGSLALAAAVVVGSGLVLGVRLIRDAIRLAAPLRDDLPAPADGATSIALRAQRITAVLGAVHHAAVLGWWLTTLGLHGGLDGVPWVTTASCAIGALVALGQWRACGHLARALASPPEHAPAASG